MYQLRELSRVAFCTTYTIAQFTLKKKLKITVQLRLLKKHSYAPSPAAFMACGRKFNIYSKFLETVRRCDWFQIIGISGALNRFYKFTAILLQIGIRI